MAPPTVPVKIDRVVWGPGTAVNVRRQDDGPALRQASDGPHIARDTAAWVLVLAGAGAVVSAGVLLGPGPLRVAVLVVALSLAGLWWSCGDAPVLLAGARPAGASGGADLAASVRALAERGGVRVPRVDVSPAREAVLFTTGRSDRSARITLSAGSLVLLDDDERRAVLAREVARVGAGGTFAATVATLVAVVNVLGVRVLAGTRDITHDRLGSPARTVARILVASEREVDERAARLLGTDDVLARALAKLDAARAVDDARSAPAVVRAIALVERAVTPPARL